MAIVWTLTGVVLISILVGAIAVSLTNETVGLDYKLYGAKVNSGGGRGRGNLKAQANTFSTTHISGAKKEQEERRIGRACETRGSLCPQN